MPVILMNLNKKRLQPEFYHIYCTIPSTT